MAKKRNGAAPLPDGERDARAIRSEGAIRSERRTLSLTFQRAILVALAAQLACKSTAGGAADPIDSPDGGSSGGVVMTSPEGGVDAGAMADARCQEVEYTPTPPDTCGDYVKLPCGLPAGTAVRATCYLNLVDCATICPDIHFNCHVIEEQCPDGGSTVIPDEAGAVSIDCATCLNSAGRLPVGLEPASFDTRSALGRYFARQAHLEAASVYAFRVLRAELVALGAPDALVRGAREAERDEVRHARSIGRLARRFGAQYVRPRVKAVPARTLEAIALDNAVEGCVRETYGALLVAWQAENAADSEVAGVLSAIAADELRHAALSWAIARWMNERLDAGARARVETACQAAIRELAAALPPAPELTQALGLPPPAASRALVAELGRSLWSDPFAAAA